MKKLYAPIIPIIAFLFLLLTMPVVYGQKYSNEFLSIGIGARAQALGNAVVADIGNVEAGFWNPAGLTNISSDIGIQIGAMHTEWFAGIGKFDYLAVALPTNNPDRRLAVSLIRFGIDGIPNTLSLYNSDGTVNFDNIKEFSAADYAFLLSYARKLKVNKGQLLVGGNVKVIHRRIGPFANSWGFGIDLGLQYHLGKLKLGAHLKDITTSFNAWSFDFTEEEKQTLELTNNEVPISSVEITKPQLIFGAAYKFQFKNVGLRPELDFIVTTDGKRNTLLSADPFSIDPAFGIEADYKEFVFLRAGINQFQRETDFDQSESLTMRPSLGVGLVLGSLHVDYAYTDLGDSDKKHSHVISLLLSLKPKSKP
ncbi:MAG: hypothetical protein DHS20C18_02840 [Saprospiraceae bacterium]|nr:MAG: hypothetical protein DHS20C18_02840 [Saprospiraceae bacterium]